MYINTERVKKSERECVYVCPPVILETWVHSLSESYRRPKKKKVLDASLFNTQHYKVQIKGKVEQHRKRISALPSNSE